MKLTTLVDSELNYEESGLNPSELRYKYCYPYYLVVLTNYSNSVTTEKRSDIKDSLHASYRSNKMFTELVVNMKTLKVVNSVTNHYFGAHTEYFTDKIVIPDSFDNDLQNSNTNGIHYFMTLEQAFLFGLLVDDYVGNSERITYYSYHFDGSLETTGDLIGRKRYGRWKFYDSIGSKLEKFYGNDTEYGKTIMYDERGNIMHEDNHGNSTKINAPKFTNLNEKMTNVEIEECISALV